jgi:hypothetical protein
MSHLLTLPLFAAASAASDNSNAVLFGHRGLALAVILLGVAVFIALVAVVGRVLAATHPDETAAAASAPDSAAKSPAAAPVAPVIASVSPEEMAAIAAAISVVLGPKVKIAEIRTPTPSVEALIQMWAIEGRRQIYTSHNFR